MTTKRVIKWKSCENESCTIKLTNEIWHYVNKLHLFTRQCITIL